MALYDYVCSNCGSHFELDRSPEMRDKSCRCPNCNKLKKHRRLPTNATVIYSGPGFYKTDSNKKGK